MNPEEKQRSCELAEILISEQSFAAAIVVGAAAAVLAAIAYGMTTAVWGFASGFAAAGIGVAVGIAMQFLGRGLEMRFAVVASLFTVAGCAIGNVCRAIMSLAREHGISPLEVFRSNAYSSLADRALSYFSLLDLVFWFVAVWCAVFLVHRPLSRTQRLAVGMYKLKD